MEAVNFLTDWIKYLLGIIPVGAAFTVTYLATRKSLSVDDQDCAGYDRKIRKTIMASIIGEAISGFITVVMSYYK